MGGKPSKGTKRDRRLKANKRKTAGMSGKQVTKTRKKPLAD